MRPKEEICSIFLITGFLILTVTAKWIFLKRLLFITLSLKMMIKMSAAMMITTMTITTMTIAMNAMLTIMMTNVIAMTAMMTIMMTNVIVMIAMMIFTTSDFAFHPE